MPKKTKEEKSKDAMTTHAVHRAECLEWLRNQPDDSMDLVFTSPPYEDRRTYDIGFGLTGEEWVAWAVERYVECVRVCRGLVAWVVEGKTSKFRWSATPAMLMADLHRAGIRLRKPPAFHRVGIPGSGGPDWWRNDYELVLCATKGKLPWSDNLATGAPCKYATGGAMSYRTQDGRRKNARGGAFTKGNDGRPKVANPGNIIHCKVGGGLMGSDLAHETEAPFPESLVEPFVKCFCPPGGVVLDPFAGSGTVAAVAKRLGRNSISIDIRDSQIKLIRRRLRETNNHADDSIVLPALLNEYMNKNTDSRFRLTLERLPESEVSK